MPPTARPMLPEMSRASAEPRKITVKLPGSKNVREARKSPPSSAAGRFVLTPGPCTRKCGPATDFGSTPDKAAANCTDCPMAGACGVLVMVTRTFAEGAEAVAVATGKRAGDAMGLRSGKGASFEGREEAGVSVRRTSVAPEGVSVPVSVREPRPRK